MTQKVDVDYRPKVALTQWFVAVVAWLWAVPALGGAFILLFLSDLPGNLRLVGGLGLAGIGLALGGGFTWFLWRGLHEQRLTARAEGFTVDEGAETVIPWDRLDGVAVRWTGRGTGRARLRGWFTYRDGDDVHRVRFGYAESRKTVPALHAPVRRVVEARAGQVTTDGGGTLGPLTYGPTEFTVRDEGGALLRVPTADVAGGQHRIALRPETNAVVFWLRLPDHPLDVIKGRVLVDLGSHRRVHRARLREPDVVAHLLNIEKLLGLKLPLIPDGG